MGFSIWAPSDHVGVGIQFPIHISLSSDLEDNDRVVDFLVTLCKPNGEDILGNYLTINPTSEIYQLGIGSSLTIGVIIQQIPDELCQDGLILRVLPVNCDDIGFCSSQPIKLRANGLQSNGFIPSTLYRKKEEFHISLSFPLGRLLTIRPTLLYWLTGLPVENQNSAPFHLYPTSPFVIAAGTSMFQIKMNTFSRDHQGQKFIIKFDIPELPEIAPFFTLPFLTENEFKKSAIKATQHETNFLLEDALRRQVVPILHDILTTVSQRSPSTSFESPS